MFYIFITVALIVAILCGLGMTVYVDQHCDSD